MQRPLTPPELRSWLTSDGYELRGRLWPGRAPGRAPVLYLHGIQSHGGWFEWSASVLAAHGSAVLLADRRGSGLNAAQRGDTPSAERWLADLDDLAAWAMQTCAASRVAVVGVSWGGKLALAWALRNSARAASLLLVAPGTLPKIGLPISTRIRIAWCALRHPDHPFPIPLDDPALFTDDPAGRSFIRADPLRLTHASARFFYHSRRIDRWLARAGRGALKTPTTVLLAGRDRIIRTAATAAWLRHLASNPRIAELEAAAHTLEFEPDTRAYEAYLREWAASLCG